MHCTPNSFVAPMNVKHRDKSQIMTAANELATLTRSEFKHAHAVEIIQVVQSLWAYPYYQEHMSHPKRRKGEGVSIRCIRSALLYLIWSGQLYNISIG